MNIPVEDLTPRQTVEELDKYIVGQAAAKRAVAVALRNRYRRQQLPESEREDILPKNILMIGPTGVGKTEIARRLAQLARAPFIKVEATKFTEVGYVGRDVESIVRDLVASAVRLVEREKMDQMRSVIEKRVMNKLIDLIDNPYSSKSKQKTVHDSEADVMLQAFEILSGSVRETDSNDEEEEEQTPTRKRRRRKIEKEILQGKYDDFVIEIEVEEQTSPFVQVFTPQGLEEMGIDANPLSSPFSARHVTRRATVGEARKVLFDQEAKKVIDHATLQREAVTRTEQTGIVFLDEIDKIVGKQNGQGPDVSREGVQRDLLPIIEGSTVATKFGPVKTDHILFIAAGAFHTSKPSEMIPELQGRLPIRVELESLTEEDFRRILEEPKNALIKQYQKLLGIDGVEIEFTQDAIDEIAHFAQEVNSRTENIGARRLHTLLEKVLESLLFTAPDPSVIKVNIDAEFVRTRVADLVKDIDLSRYIL